MATPKIDEQVGLRVGFLHVTGTENAKVKDGCAERVAEVLDSGKGLADFYGILDKGAQVADLANMAAWTPWTAHVSKQFKVGRAVGAVPYLLTVGLNMKKDPSFRNGLELIKIGGYAAAAVMPTNAAQAVNVGTVAGVALDAVDLSKELTTYQACKEASGKPMAAATKSVIDRHLTTGAAKILKLALCIFAGLVAIAGSIFEVAISGALATAALVAGLAALVISFSLSYADLAAPFKSKVAILPPLKPAVV